MTLSHPAYGVALESFKAALQELETIVRYPTVGANCHGFVTADVLEKGLNRGAIAMD